MQYEVILEIIIALFAVYGVYAAMRTLAEAIFRSDNILLAVEVRTNDDASNVDFLLREAKGAYTVRGKRGRIIVLLSKRFEGNTDVLDMISAAGAEYIIYK